MGDYEQPTTKIRKKSDKPRAKPSRLSDVDASIILTEASKLKEKVEVLEDGPNKTFLLLHVNRIVNKLARRLEQRGGKSRIMEMIEEEE